MKQFYPPEEMFRDEFIERVKEAEKRVKEGKGRYFKDADELNAFLESLKTEDCGALPHAWFHPATPKTL